MSGLPVWEFASRFLHLGCRTISALQPGGGGGGGAAPVSVCATPAPTRSPPWICARKAPHVGVEV